MQQDDIALLMQLVIVLVIVKTMAKDLSGLREEFHSGRTYDPGESYILERELNQLKEPGK